MQYMFQLYADERRWADPSTRDAQDDLAAYYAYTEALKSAGAFVAGDALQPTATATCVRVGTDGKPAVLDGPYAETKEQLGGYYVIEAPDLDSAIAWAARCPGASHGTIEVRPILVLRTETAVL
jgi:hypothetical protein